MDVEVVAAVQMTKMVTFFPSSVGLNACHIIWCISVMTDIDFELYTNLKSINVNIWSNLHKLTDFPKTITD